MHDSPAEHQRPIQGKRIILGTSDLHRTNRSNEKELCLFCCVMANNGHSCGSIALIPVTAFVGGGVHIQSDFGVRLQM